MGRKRTPGLFKRGKVWHIDKFIGGSRTNMSTGATTLAEAELILARQIEQTRNAQIFGIRPKRSFQLAADKYILENPEKADTSRLRNLMPWIGHLNIDEIHMGTLEPWIKHRQREGRKQATINRGLAAVRRILNLAADEWIDEYGLTWLERRPKIKLFSEDDARPPHPITWEEQDRLLKELPPHLVPAVLFAINTGCRESVIYRLRWKWEVRAPALNMSFFRIPKNIVKTRQPFNLVLNRIAANLVEEQRGRCDTHVFDYKGKPRGRINNTAWQNAVVRADLPDLHFHDLRHTFGSRLRGAGVSEEDRAYLLAHKGRSMTTHYSAPLIVNLVKTANRVCERNETEFESIISRS